ncbi:MAG: DUF664 domain-containing protein, partial [Acidimicrobiales bacterium]
FWNEKTFLSHDTASLYESDSDSDLDFNALTFKSVETVVDQWLRHRSISRSIVAGRDLDNAGALTPDFPGGPVELHLLAVHDFEECARNCENADCLRRGVDRAIG